MNLCSNEEHCKESLQVKYSRELSHNASEIHYYDDYLEKIKKFAHTNPSDIQDVLDEIDALWRKRKTLEECYLKAVRENK
jgi:hypothetical protein